MLGAAGMVPAARARQASEKPKGENRGPGLLGDAVRYRESGFGWGVVICTEDRMRTGRDTDACG